MFSFSGQGVMVTAGASGIGEAIATAFADSDALVHVVDADSDAAKKMSGQIPGIMASVADVSDEDILNDVFNDHFARIGRLDVMVNCAGIAGPTALVEDVTLEEWRRCIAVSLDATFMCCRHAIPAMRKAGSGSIVNISSTAGWHGYPLRSPYASAKWGVIGLTKSLAMELGPAGIRANAVCPGSIDGERMTRVIEAEAATKGLSEQEVREKYTSGVSMRTFIQASDIADTVLFLSSPAASKITGQVINVDGHLESVGGLDQ